MNLENKTFDEKLIILNEQLKNLQSEILRVEKAKKDYVSNNLRSDFLIRNSVDFKNVNLEVHDGIYFIVAEDDSFTYAMRLNQYQAEVLADDLDAKLGEKHVDSLFQKEIIKDMFGPYLKNISKQ